MMLISVVAKEEDDVARVTEAVTRTVICALKSAQSDDNTDDWLNPTEVINNNCSLMSFMLACLEFSSTLCTFLK